MTEEFETFAIIPQLTWLDYIYYRMFGGMSQLQVFVQGKMSAFLTYKCKLEDKHILEATYCAYDHTTLYG